MKVSNNFSLSSQRVRGERKHGENPNPVLLFPKRLIDDAVNQAKKTQRGQATRDAVYARMWIVARPDWKDVDEFYSSFEWCCHWYYAGVFKPEHCEKYRIEKLEEIDLALKVAAREWNVANPGDQTVVMSDSEVKAMKRMRMHRVPEGQMGFCWA